MKELDRPLYVRLGQQLKEARLTKGFSLQYVADKVGVNKTTIKRYEDAKVRIDMDTLKKLGDILGMQIMDVTATYNGSTIEHNVSLYQTLDELNENDPELREANSYFAELSSKMMDRFVHLDINLQKSILIMMRFDEDEISKAMKFLH